MPSLNTVPGVTNDVNGVTNTATGTVQNLLPGTTSGVNGDASNLSTQVESILSDLVDKLQGITSGAVGTLKSGLPTDTVGSITSGNLHSGAGQIKQTTAELNALVPVDATLDVGGVGSSQRRPPLPLSDFGRYHLSRSSRSSRTCWPASCSSLAPL